MFEKSGYGQLCDSDTSGNIAGTIRSTWSWWVERVARIVDMKFVQSFDRGTRKDESTRNCLLTEDARLECSET